MNWRPLTVTGLLLASGCGREEIKVYTVAKEQTQPALPAGHPELTQPAKPQLKWQTPAGWKEGVPGDFRVASFRVLIEGQEADVSVIPLPGMAGGDLSNVNRWRNQVSQPPVTEAELAKLAQPVTISGQPAQMYEQDGEGATGDPTRILAAIQHRDGTAWFFKMTGASKLVAEQKPAFVEFLKSCQFEVSALPAGHPPMEAHDGIPHWSPPADWKEVSGGQFLAAKFLIANGSAAVNISTSPGDGGGLPANVNRWRKQLGLPEEATPAVTAGEISICEFNGTDAKTGQPAALVGAIVFRPGQAWFYKLMGEAPVVAAQRDAFLKFVREVRY